LLFRYGRARFHAESAGAEILVEARDALLAAGDPEAAAEALIMLGELAWMRGAPDDAFRHLEDAAALLSERPASHSKAYTLSSLSRFLMIASRHERAIRIGREAFQMAEELGLDELQAHALDSIGTARAAVGDPGGLADLEQSIVVATALNSIEAVRAYVNLGTTLAELGDLKRAFDLYERGRRAAEGFGDPDRIRWFEEEQLYEWYWRGNWDQAHRRADELIAELEKSDPHMVELDSRLVRARILLARGAREGALDDSARALEFGRHVGYPEALFPSLAFRARVLAAVGRLEEAGTLARELLELWSGHGATGASFWTADLACVLWFLESGDEVHAAARRAQARTRWLDAAEAFGRGELMRAADLYAEIGARPDEAFARLHAAARAARQGRPDESRAQLDQALVFYQEVGAETYLREGEALARA
jgi:tetratricopeptide (TPR) repeat protein